MENHSNSSNDTDPCAMENPGLYIQIMGSILFVVVWPFIVLDMKWFPLGRPAAALVGAMLMVLFQVVTQDEVYEVEGKPEKLQTIYLLMGMMIMSYYYDREGILRIASLWIIGDNKPFRTILWKICLLSAALSAFITNDAACLVITPLILSEFVKKKRNKKELLPLCLGIATSANIGSAATIFGNPQNAFIASVTGVSLLDFIIAELPSALFGLALSIGLLHVFSIKVLCIRGDVIQEEEEVEANETDTLQQHIPPYHAASLAEEREAHAMDYDQSNQPFLTSQVAMERSLMFNSGSSRHQLRSFETMGHNNRIMPPGPRNGYLARSLTRSRRTIERVRFWYSILLAKLVTSICCCCGTVIHTLCDVYTKVMPLFTQFLSYFTISVSSEDISSSIFQISNYDST